MIKQPATGGTKMPGQVSDWVREIYTQHANSGTSSTGNVQRVLGDQRKSVEVPISNERAAASVWPMKS